MYFPTLTWSGLTLTNRVSKTPDSHQLHLNAFTPPDQEIGLEPTTVGPSSKPRYCGTPQCVNNGLPEMQKPSHYLRRFVKPQAIH